MLNREVEVGIPTFGDENSGFLGRVGCCSDEMGVASKFRF